MLDPAWSFVVVIPDEELATAAARRVLPANVPFADAVANLSSLGMLIAGLAHHEDFVASSMDDALHQPYRASLLPYSTDLLASLRDAGAAGSCWSGAGSTMLALVTADHADAVVASASEFLVDRGVAGDVRHLQVDTTGLVRS